MDRKIVNKGLIDQFCDVGHLRGADRERFAERLNQRVESMPDPQKTVFKLLRHLIYLSRHSKRVLNYIDKAPLLRDVVGFYRKLGAALEVEMSGDDRQ
jgi:hypothetical protein